MAVYDVPPSDLIERLVDHLKRRVKSVSPPAWASLVKTGAHAERPPQDPDWWYVRCASLLRKLYVKGPLGISRLRKQYGGKRRWGSRRAHFVKAGGSIIRHALQQLEEAKLVESVDKRGRSLTKEGRNLLDKMATQISKELTKRGKR